MPLSDAALTTVEAVATELSLTVDASPTDPVRLKIEGLIEDASAMVAAYLQRGALEFSDAVVERLEGDGSDLLLLRRRPLVSITSVAFNEAAVLASSYEIQDEDAGSIFFFGGVVDDQYRTTRNVARDPAGTRRRSYVVTYAGGWKTPGQTRTGGSLAGETTTLPRVIQRAALEATCWLYQNPGGDGDIASESALSYSVSYRGSTSDASGAGLPASVTAKLAPWVDVTFA